MDDVTSRLGSDTQRRHRLSVLLAGDLRGPSGGHSRSVRQSDHDRAQRDSDHGDQLTERPDAHLHDHDGRLRPRDADCRQRRPDRRLHLRRKWATLEGDGREEWGDRVHV